MRICSENRRKRRFLAGIQPESRFPKVKTKCDSPEYIHCHRETLRWCKTMNEYPVKMQ